jgi:hypothetical protein
MVVMARAVDSARNLMPSAFGLAADPQADIKARWEAFDQLYDYVTAEMQRHGCPHRPNPIKSDGPTPEQVREISERNMRMQVAATLLATAYGSDPKARSAVYYQAEELVPTGPDPESWRPRITMQDQVVLFEAASIVREDMAEDWACFFKAESEPLERRKLAFRRIYACMGGVWCEQSDFVRSFELIYRQRHIILALMCHVPREQRTTEDLQGLWDELLPIEEPDWDSIALQIGR